MCDHPAVAWQVAIQQCPKCKINLKAITPNETIEWFIGGHVLKCQAVVPQGVCPRCNFHWESPNARQIRNAAIKSAVDTFWAKALSLTFLEKADDVRRVRVAVAEIMYRLGHSKRERLAEDFGRWLANLYYPE